MIAVQKYHDQLNQAIGKADKLKQEKAEYEKMLKESTDRLKVLDEALVLIQTVAQKTQSQLVYHINNVVNTALDTVFPGEYSFELLFEVKRNKTEARLVFYKNGFEIDPLQASGGGVVDIASFALRVATWSLGKTRSTLCLDEPMKWLSKDLQAKAGEILKEMSETLSLQIIMGSHIPELIEVADTVYNVSLKDGVSTITCVK